MMVNMNTSPLLSQLDSLDLGVLMLYTGNNVLCFGMYAWDKYAAIRGLPRVSEKQLLIWTMLSGGVIAYLAQQCLRHKTKKSIFQWAAIVAFLLHLGVWSYVLTR